jgi:hypothetical protein
VKISLPISYSAYFCVVQKIHGMRFTWLILLGWLCKSVLLAQPAYDSHSLVVRFAPGLFPNQLAFAPQGQWKVVWPEKNVYAYSWTTGESPEEMMARLKQTGEGLVYVHFNYRADSRIREPNDPSFSLQWHHKTIQSAAAWVNQTGGLTAAGDTIVVAVLEKRSVDFTHDDLQGTMRINYGEIPDNQLDDDGNGYIDDYLGLNAVTLRDNNLAPDNHATRIGGLIGATGNNGIGISGVNWQVKMLSVSNVDLITDILSAFRYVLNERRRYNNSAGSVGSYIVAVNASFGFDQTKPEDAPVFADWCDLIHELGQEGVITVGATSNSRWDVDFVGDMPTNCTSPFMIGVTATNRLDTLDRAAAFGLQSIDLGAPGEALFSTRTGNAYNAESGTSYAAPLVTGAVALLYSMPDPDFSLLSREDPAAAASVVKQAILHGTDPLASLKGRTVTGGRLNLYRSVEEFSRLGYGTLPDRIALTSVFPNPVRDRLYYSFGFDGNQDHEVLISDMVGRVWLMDRLEVDFYPAQRHELNIAHLPPGIYFLMLRNGRKMDAVRFIKEDAPR